jgi:hypothetical protein
MLNLISTFARLDFLTTSKHLDMRTISIFFSLFLIIGICHGQTQSNTADAGKTKMTVKASTFVKENDALTVDRLLGQCENVLYSHTDFKTGICEIVTNGVVSLEAIKKCLVNSDYQYELVSTKPLTEEEYKDIISKKKE